MARLRSVVMSLHGNRRVTENNLYEYSTESYVDQKSCCHHTRKYLPVIKKPETTLFVPTVLK
jgi:hypothetical protein